MNSDLLRQLEKANPYVVRFRKDCQRFVTGKDNTSVTAEDVDQGNYWARLFWHELYWNLVHRIREGHGWYYTIKTTPLEGQECTATLQVPQEPIEVGGQKVIQTGQQYGASGQSEIEALVRAYILACEGER